MKESDKVRKIESTEIKIFTKKIRNETTREQMNLNLSAIHWLDRKQLIWYNRVKTIYKVDTTWELQKAVGEENTGYKKSEDA